MTFGCHRSSPQIPPDEKFKISNFLGNHDACHILLEHPCLQDRNATDNNGQCKSYIAFKHANDIAPYLVLLDRQFRLPITKFRCLNNRLPIVTGRFAAIDRAERYCPLCLINGTRSIGDEYHFILECHYFLSAPVKYIDKSYFSWPI